MARKAGQSRNKKGSAQEPIIPFWPEDAPDDLNRIQEELSKQTDRGAAVLGTSFVEWRVRQAISTRLKIWDSNAERIFGTDDRGGELGFTDQCRMAYCLGLVGPIGLKDLETIARIRNRFAHHLSITSFADQKISTLCGNLKTPELWHDFYVRVMGRLKIPKTKPPTEPRTRFILSVNVLNANIWGVAVRGIIDWPEPQVPGMTPFW
jgi:hypothetical protein